ncbi:MAG: metallophosphoesterase [Bacteroidetes bacterium]|nr:metallophosphoesterase [Bacteroidota bacterium]MBU1421823.1 metallophosphoesterase [Bacteroidota bacterium]MBU2636337.1 metallophosphoesterase [Bacteroidota bacterium]
MKILAFTDIHGAYKKVEEIIKSELADVVIIGGDLTNVGSVKEADRVIESFTRLSKNLFCIAGNMDLPQHDELYLNKSIGLNGNGIVVQDIGFFGVSGSSYTSLNTPYEISEETIADKIIEGYTKVKDAKIKILISHTPPYGTKVDIIRMGIHVGSTAVREFTDDYQPDVVVCGHIHEARGQDVIAKTKIVNCGPASRGYYVVIDINDNIDILMKEKR